MVQEWLDAVLTVEWLLGASMAFAGRQLRRFVSQTYSAFRSKGRGPGESQEPDTGA